MKGQAINAFQYTHTNIDKKKNELNISSKNMIDSMSTLGAFNRGHLSKSIVIHHHKNAGLISTMGRYNDLNAKGAEDEDYGGINLENEEETIHLGQTKNKTAIDIASK